MNPFILTLKIWLRAQLAMAGFLIVFAIVQSQFWYLLGIPASMLLGIPVYFLYLMLLQIVKGSPTSDRQSITSLSVMLGIIAVMPINMLCSHMATGQVWFWQAGHYAPLLAAPLVCTTGAIISYHKSLYRISHPHLFNDSSNF